VKILLDTHILLRWMADDRRLPRPARLAQLPSKAEA
jgi:PIN domain nuclease of toxin-antitoxin system